MDDRLGPDWLAQVPGASELINWFGYWPGFHDAEVISIELARSGASRLCVHAFESTGTINSKGHYICQRHVVVKFLLTGIRQLQLIDFNQQNVLAGLTLRRVEQGCEVKLEGCDGVDGVIVAESVRIELSTGVPPDSQYLTEGTP